MSQSSVFNLSTGLSLSSATAIGLRPYQEDRAVVHPTEGGVLLAVLDGHGGAECAHWCSESIPELWDSLFDSADVCASIVRLIVGLDAHTQGYSSGAALSLVYLEGKQAHVAVIGDAPVIIHCADGTIDISPEHNVRTNEAEKLAAEKRGGYYRNGYICTGGHGLQMSRALGDSRMRAILSREPEIYTREVGDFILLATDGAFDPGHSNAHTAIDEVVKMIRNGADAQAIVDRAEKEQTGDNATAILLRTVAIEHATKAGKMGE